jgi:hypothetical protein
MATINAKNINTLSLTDCLYFTNGHCMFKGKCHYRHCQAAIKQLEKCPNWPDSCRNVDCPYRHIGTPSQIPKSLPQEKNLVTFFWDIENVPIPKGKKPFDIVQRIRDKLVVEPGFQEADFSCYCNINTISQENQQNLSHAAVRIIHVPDRKPGAVDRQIMLDLDRFERTHRPPATVVLISGDIDFVGKLSDLRHQARFHVIVIHNKPAKEELKATVNEHYSWELFTEPLQQQQMPQPVIRNNLKGLTNQPASFRQALKDRLNNDNNVNRIASPALPLQPLMPVYDSPHQNNHQQKNALDSNFPKTHRRSESVTRMHRSKSAPRKHRLDSGTRRHRSRHRADAPLRPPITQPVNQTLASNAGSNTHPSASIPIVAPRARIRQAVNTNQLNQQDILISSSCEQIASAINDDTTKIQPNQLSCPYCTNKFDTMKALRQHQKDKKHLFDCPVCKTGFPTESGLKQHQMAKHNSSTDIDNQCNVQLDTADNLNTHQFATHSEHNLNMPNNHKRPPMYPNPKANCSIIDESTNNVNCVVNDEN